MNQEKDHIIDDSLPSDKYLNPYRDIEIHRHHLPHWQQGQVYIFLTWHLADSLPVAVMQSWHEEKQIWLKLHPLPCDVKTEQEYKKRFFGNIEKWLDKGIGSCVLRDQINAQIVKKALLFFDGVRYDHEIFVIMPNHVHILFSIFTPFKLADVVKSWKGYTAYAINKRMNRQGALWHEDYWDRLIRNEKHFEKCRQYILNNPIKAHLREGQFLLYEKVLLK